MKARLEKRGNKELLKVEYTDTYQSRGSQNCITIPLTTEHGMVSIKMTQECLYDIINIINNREIK